MVIAIRKNDPQQSLLVNIDVEPTSTVADIKGYIGRVQRGNHSPELNLHFNGKLLQDEHTLRDCGVGPRSTLLLSEIFLVHVMLRRLPRATSKARLVSVKVISTDRVADIINQVIEKEHLPQSTDHLLLTASQGLFAGYLVSECSIQNGSILRLEGRQ